ncbi:MAG: hypothetical protein ACYC0E_09325, partial [Acidimicrobiales bacterium]
MTPESVTGWGKRMPPARDRRCAGPRCRYPVQEPELVPPVTEPATGSDPMADVAPDSTLPPLQVPVVPDAGAADVEAPDVGSPGRPDVSWVTTCWTVPPTVATMPPDPLTGAGTPGVPGDDGGAVVVVLGGAVVVVLGPGVVVVVGPASVREGAAAPEPSGAAPTVGR